MVLRYTDLTNEGSVILFRLSLSYLLTRLSHGILLWYYSVAVKVIAIASEDVFLTVMA